MLIAPQASPLLTKQALAVSSKGENVVLSIGTTDLAMHYEHALALSRWMRQEAQWIKSGRGRSKATRTLGVMHDIDAAPLKPLPYTQGAAIHVNPKLHSYRREDISTQGRLVSVKVGASTFSLHYENALKVAQWLRVRAKESRNTAGDVRHWSEIGGDE
jgi:hypothetical protein